VAIRQYGMIRLALRTAIRQALYCVSIPSCIRAHDLPEDPEITKTSYRIPRKLKKDVERYSVESDKTETEIIKEALEEYLQRHWKK